MKVAAIIQARMGSSRLPGKVMLSMDKGCALGLLIDRVKKSELLHKIVVATSYLVQDDPVHRFCVDRQVDVYRGDEQDVLKRYYEAAKYVQADIVVRITADCPLFDAAILDEMLLDFFKRKVDYLSNSFPHRFYPKGLDTEIFTFQALEKAFVSAQLPEEREHVTLFLHREEIFNIANFDGPTDLSQHRWTLDYPEDYYFLRRIYNYLDDPLAGYQQVLAVINHHPELCQLSHQLNQLYP